MVSPPLVIEFYLAALYGLALTVKYSQGLAVSELGRIIAVAIGLGLPYLIIKGRSPRLVNIVITGLILLLLADQKTPWPFMIGLGLLTTTIKTFIRSQHLPIFNPAAAGLFSASFLGITTTWWGVNFSPRLPLFSISVAMLLTLPVGLFIFWTYKRLPTLISVVALFTLGYWWWAGRPSFTILLEGTFAFFLFIMAMEPRTTPVIDKQEWVYGSILGIILAFLFTHRLVTSSHLISLLTLNLLFSIYRKVTAPNKPKTARPTKK